MDTEELLERYADGERDFAGITLKSVDLQEAILIDINFCGADLSYSNFDDADLSNANLSNAKLDSTKFNGATLEGANLHGITLDATEADFANFNSANLSNTNLSVGWKNTDLSNADLSSSLWDHTWLESVNLSSANLSNIQIYQSTILKANLRGANLDKAFFGDNSDIKECNIIAVDLSTITIESWAGMAGSLYNAETIVPGEVNLEYLGGIFCQTVMPDGTIRDDDCLENEEEVDE
jgi:uncharacterized protein YjbI with pentapeptide repeats